MVDSGAERPLRGLSREAFTLPGPQLQYGARPEARMYMVSGALARLEIGLQAMVLASERGCRPCIIGPPRNEA